MGPDKIVTLLVGKWELKALFQYDVKMNEGDVLPLSAKSSRICLFDARSGVRLNPDETRVRTCI